MKRHRTQFHGNIGFLDGLDHAEVKFIFFLPHLCSLSYFVHGHRVLSLFLVTKGHILSTSGQNFTNKNRRTIAVILPKHREEHNAQLKTLYHVVFFRYHRSADRAWLRVTTGNSDSPSHCDFHSA